MVEQAKQRKGLLLLLFVATSKVGFVNAFFQFSLQSPHRGQVFQRTSSAATSRVMTTCPSRTISAIFHTSLSRVTKSRSVKTKTSSRFPLCYQQDQNIDPDTDITDIHRMVNTCDPKWYQEFVLDVLGSDFVESKWQSSEQPVIKEMTAMDVAAATTTTSGSAIPQSEAIDETEQPVKEGLASKAEWATDSTGSDQILDMEIKMGSDLVESVSKAQLGSDSTLSGQKMIMDAEIKEESNEVTTSSNEPLDVSEVKSQTTKGAKNVIESSTPQDKKTSFFMNENRMAEIAEKMVNNNDKDSVVSDKSSNTFLKSEAINRVQSPEEQEQQQASTQTDVIKPTTTRKEPMSSSDDNKSVVSSSASTSPVSSNAEEKTDEKRVVVYKDLGEKLQSIPLANLTALGYRVEEIQFIRSDALSVIINDSVERPRVGLPPQWRIASPKTKDATSSTGTVSNNDIIIVGDPTEAEELVLADMEQRRERRMRFNKNVPPKVVKPPTTSSKRPPTKPKGREMKNKGANDPSSLDGVSFSQSSKSSRKAMMSSSDVDDPKAPIRGRERLQKQQRVSKQSQSSKKVKTRSSTIPNILEQQQQQQQRRSKDPKRGIPVDEQPRRRQRQRTNLQEDGTPKRIYNGREIRGQKQSTSSQSMPRRDDPPDPNSPLWMSMDKFRGLLRNEAELRLRILGDGWAPTVKQECDWRLDLYKNWLWTLHNGVGDSIVPPSRYDRARSIGEKRAREAASTTQKQKQQRKSNDNSDDDTSNSGPRPRTRRPRNNLNMFWATKK